MIPSIFCAFPHHHSHGAGAVLPYACISLDCAYLQPPAVRCPVAAIATFIFHQVSLPSELKELGSFWYPQRTNHWSPSLVKPGGRYKSSKLTRLGLGSEWEPWVIRFPPCFRPWLCNITEHKHEKRRFLHHVLCLHI